MLNASERRSVKWMESSQRKWIKTKSCDKAFEAKLCSTRVCVCVCVLVAGAIATPKPKRVSLEQIASSNTCDNSVENSEHGKSERAMEIYNCEITMTNDCLMQFEESLNWKQIAQLPRYVVLHCAKLADDRGSRAWKLRQQSEPAVKFTQRERNF